MINYEVYEDNAGGLYLCILDATGRCKHIIEGWEYDPAGILNDALAELRKNPTTYTEWDGDLVKRLNYDGVDADAKSLYDKGLGTLIADSTGYINPHMGCAGKKAFNIID